MWVRGLKPDFNKYSKMSYFVAPHVGAWIETRLKLVSCCLSLVAPHVGAWIET